ncbi:DUF3500 domain-containing protein [Deinococcus ruber]|uniref:DUF3500 domain-containing protein n=1 Tax=Deinococcus ruber TaxID=1848197 RepID=A0A918CH32_9DEIO|nr:DUF3500 domain-containing protein [Deinococcus ruber]GGR23306.1 hypothetical protein GCM10008957_39060 [Deinococcus ruber]
MNRFLTLALLVGAATIGVRTLSTALAGGSGSATTSTAASLQANGTVVTTGVSLPGQHVPLPADCARVVNETARVVCTANAFLATLSAAQKAQVLLPASKANAVKWSNLPTTFVPRNGVRFSTLSAAQLTAAEAVVKAAMGSTPNEGYDEAMKIRMADDVLNASGGMGGPNSGTGIRPAPPAGQAGMTGTPPAGTPPTDTPPTGNAGGGSDYGNGLYFLAFLGTPSTTGTWQLQFGGHHLALNTTYKAGEVVGATPKFTGLEPKVWTANGVTYAPMEGEHSTLVSMLAGLNSAQLATARLSQSFSDVLLGPGQDGKFPAKKSGLRVGTLSAGQQARVLAAIKTWVQDVDDTTAATLLGIYQKELGSTYIAYSGSAGLTKQADYVRIDGPSVWIEFVCQNGIVYNSQIHYHTIWRDHTRDYGAVYSF